MRLAGQPDHEVELQTAPAVPEGQLGAAAGSRRRSRPLLITSRIRWLPASGAKVKPARRPARCDRVDQLDREGVDARARQRDGAHPAGALRIAAATSSTYV